LKAIAVKDGLSSNVASATYTLNVPLTIAEVREQGTGSVVKTIGVVTSCVGKNVYIQDATAAILVYGDEEITDLAIGDEIVVSGTLATYKGLLEIKTPTYTKNSEGNTVTPEVMTVAQVNESEKQGWLVKIENATVTAIEGSNTTIDQDGATILVFGISSDVTLAVGDIITLTGNI
jgi:predicted extracellular nuclease